MSPERERIRFDFTSLEGRPVQVTIHLPVDPAGQRERSALVSVWSGSSSAGCIRADSFRSFALAGRTFNLENGDVLHLDLADVARVLGALDRSLGLVAVGPIGPRGRQSSLAERLVLT